MHRLYQSRKRLTQSIASAATAEDKLLASMAAEKPTSAKARVEGLEASVSTSEKLSPSTHNQNNTNNDRKRQLEEHDNPQANKTSVMTERSRDVVLNGDDSGDSSLGPPPHKKTTTTTTMVTDSPQSRNAADGTISSTVASEMAATITPGGCAESPVNNKGNKNNDSQAMVIDLATSRSSSPGPLEDHSEVCIVAPPPPGSLLENCTTNESNGDDDNEDEIQIVSSTTINPNIQYPHKRTDCGLHDFQADPQKFCRKCYCVVCDIPASECTYWKDHCSLTQRPRDDSENEDGYGGENDCDNNPADDTLLESPTATARNYHLQAQGRAMPEQQQHLLHEEQEQPMSMWERQREEDRARQERHEETDTRNMCIADVLALKISRTLQLAEQHSNQRVELKLSEGGRENSSVEKNTANNYSQGAAATAAPATASKVGIVQKNDMEGDIPQLGLHTAFFVEGIKIGWPFPEIMTPQRQMAIHIIKALKRKLHVVLESPTGTGKSVAILCSVLAWQRYHIQTTTAIDGGSKVVTDPVSMEEEEEEGTPRIIYLSRTHSQVSQMVASLKKTPYRPKMTILGSRERLCIHKEVMNRSTNKLPINMACKDRRKNTDAERRLRIKHDKYYDDDDPKPPQHNGDGDPSDLPNDNDNEHDSSNVGRPQKPKLTCPHYRQLTSNRTAHKVVRQFIGGHRIQQHKDSSTAIDGCGCSSTVGGEESAFGIHDVEDLVRFGKNPHKEENIAIYRGETGKFGFLINNNTNPQSGEEVRGCYVVSLVEGGAAAFEARLRNGDRLLKVNGKDVRTWNKRRVVELLARTPKDQPARLDVLRDDADTPEILDAQQEAETQEDPNGQELGARSGMQENDIYSDHSVCPYYISRTLHKHAEITFSPYNYILDPSIRRSLNISLRNTVLVLDEAHNVESTLCESGSGKYGEIDLFQVASALGPYARRTVCTGNTGLINSDINVDTAIIAHDLLLFVEKIIFHLKGLREKFENGPSKQKLEDEYKKYHNTPDNHEVELTYDGPTGYGIKGAAVGCQPLLTRIGITIKECSRLLEYALSLEQSIFGGNSESDGAILDRTAQGDTSNILNNLIQLLTKLLTAAENPEHYYMSCIVQANGNLDHAFGLEDDNNQNAPRRRFKKKPRRAPFMSPKTSTRPDAFLNDCNIIGCPNAGRAHGDYCDGSTPPWECHLIIRLLSPGLLMREISQECRSVVFASGSLAPIPSMCAELNLFGKDQSTSSLLTSPSSKSNLSHLSTPPIRSRITGAKLPEISQALLDSLVKSTHGGIKKLYTNRLQMTPKPLEANHVVNLPKQLLAVAIGNFPDGERMTISYSNYKFPSFFPKLGDAIASVIESVPKGGCLVFFPSYSLLQKCVSCWNATGYSRFQVSSPQVWNRILRSKGKVVVEPTGSQEDFESARDDFQDTIRETGSCVLLAVFRGKMSEGISFNDDYARAVICIGMPLPNLIDRRIKAKKAYNDEQRKLRHKTCLLPGEEYYKQQAHRAIAQALGRCIRHGADYGTVILMDSRHCDDGSPNGGICLAHKNLPKWMRGSVRTLSMSSRQGPGKQPILCGYMGLKRTMRSFFATAPIASQAVRDKWKADLEAARQRSKAGGSGMVFHRDTGNWTKVTSTKPRRTLHI